MAKKKRKKRGNSSRYGKDFHHLLYQRRHWSQGYARALRNHPYMGKMIPRDSLHSLIHSKIHDIPCPNGRECRMAYEEVVRREREGLIDVLHDSCEQRLDLLIEIWEDKCPATVAVLKWQRDLIAKNYEGGE